MEKFKKILFIVYHDLHHNARSQEILQMAEMLAENVFLLSQSKPTFKTNAICYVCKKSKTSYFKFLVMGKRLIRKIKPDCVVLHDNYTAPLLKYIVDNRIRIPIIYDSSELYIDRVLPNKMQLMIHNYMESAEINYLKYALVSIAANQERAEIMTKKMQLKRPTIVFNNMHRIDDMISYEECRKKFDSVIRKGKINILYAGGISQTRRTYELADAVTSLGEDYHLLIAGAENETSGWARIKQIQKEKGIENITYIGYIKRSEMKYLFHQVDFSVAMFAEDTLNNIYCASGKLYESLFEGTPVLVSENPPLKRICKDHGIGVSNNNLRDGIQEMSEHLELYKRNVTTYMNSIDYESRVRLLTQQITEFISEYQNGTINLDF